MTDEEQTREQIEEIVNNVDEPVKEEPVKEEIKEENPIEEVKEEIKPKAKPRASRAKPKQIKIVKESVEPVEPVVEEKPKEPVVEVVEVKPEPVKVDKLKQIVKCPDCKMDMTVHTLKYIHKRRGFCKADVKPEVVPEKTPEPIVQQKPKITDEIVNDYIKQNPDSMVNYLRNERAMKAQRKQMNARSLLKNAF